ncbi:MULTISPECIES: hypothetical protein [Alkalimonas]|uniref:Lipoprotein n=2 Tax=Alkalimonas TaxID=265980 RepID=A0ABU7J2Y5_9GAMM|nr:MULTISPECIES: hypothetical protein [unclassified Alkalimonas]MEE2000769.1 hypothetical protein [Alkalimonas sp. MEB108]MEE2025870.1 hypothetical protein [Alkalimonas sp. MEB004]
MKVILVGLVLLSLVGCQLLGSQQAAPEPEVVAEQVELEPEPEPTAEPQRQLSLADDSDSLLAWLQFRQQVLSSSSLQREQWELEEQPELAAIQTSLMQLHPENNYLTRFRAQMQLAEHLMLAAPDLAALFGWDLAFNQKLLEAESAISALSRTLADVQHEHEQLRARNLELEQQIEALTQIEARLNQPDNGVNNEQP